ncbi:MAG: ArsB/NhaD family transporter [Anaerolineae bacterium]|nr:ArsB/NhaD family transporter [Anaerolineae bacterium]
MSKLFRTKNPASYLALVLILGLWLARQIQPPPVALASGRGVAGHVFDGQGEPVIDADLKLYINKEDRPVAKTRSQPDGAYLLVLPEAQTASYVRVEVERPHFKLHVWTPDGAEFAALLEEDTFVTHDIIMERRIVASFWITAAIFIGMLAIIATERLHNTVAALLAMVLIFGVSLLGEIFSPDLFIFTFDQAIEYVDFEVIFLLLGMMIVIGVIEETGIFQWLAFQAYRLSRGKVWLLSMILMSITAIASALLDNVTTMLLITPIILEIALAAGINPLSLVLPALLSANVGGLATLVGTPVNIMIGSFVGLDFNDFVVHLTPGVLMALLGLMVFVQLRYWKEYHTVGGGLSPALMKQLEENGRIRDPLKLRKGGIVFGVLLLLFVLGEPLHLPPTISAIAGAVAMLLWVNPDIREMMSVVDWTTLVFFIGLFVVVGAVQEVGILAVIADGIVGMVGTSLMASLLSIVWIAALLSGMIDNIPFAAAMLPIVKLLTRIIPGAESNVLYYGLAIGADLGGNSSLIGSSANLVVAGITERAGYRITFRKFLKVGIPAMAITTAIGSLWLIIHFI